MYQRDLEFESDVQDDKADEENLMHPHNSNVFGPVTLLKGVVVIGSAFVVSFFAFSNNSRSAFLSHQKTAISTLTSLDQLPRETVFAEVSDEDKEHLFGLFSRQFNKEYTDSDYSVKLATFKTSLHAADARNYAEKVRGGSARHGITKYSDMTHEEFKQKLLKAKPTSRESAYILGGGDDEYYYYSLPFETTFKSIDKYEGDVTAVDWTGVYTTPVVDQGYCGSCWAFSATEQIESDAIRSGLLTPNDRLSVQQMISCDDTDDGCEGGWTELGFLYAMANGMELETDYPYVSYFGQNGQCAMEDAKVAVRVTEYYGISSEDEMIDYVLTTGPLSVCTDSTDWVSYVDGVVTSCGNNVNHCVQAVGVDTVEGTWKIRNTWGSDWGEDGYIRLATGSNLCGIVTDAAFSVVSK